MNLLFYRINAKIVTYFLIIILKHGTKQLNYYSVYSKLH